LTPIARAMWIIASSLGLLGLLLTLIALVLLAYAAISHLGRHDRKVRWYWRRGIVWFAVRLFAGGLLLQLMSFVGRIALAG
jgi:hypothetical protein